MLQQPGVTHDLIARRPGLARGILFGGAVAYILLCQPAVWERGYPRIDPFWQAMPLLWVFPLLISGVLDDNRGRRFRALLVFSLAAGLIPAGTFGPQLVPRRVSLWSIMFAAVFWVPLLLGVSLVLERVAQFVLGKVRRFTDLAQCRRCGYCLRFLTVARCPECGTPFDGTWLHVGTESPEPTRHPWRTRAVIASLLLVAVATPFVFQWAALALAWRSGWITATRDWAAGTAHLYVDYGRIPILSAHGILTDPLTRLPLHFTLGGIERETSQRAYNAAIGAELVKQGRRSILEYILAPDELEVLLQAASLQRGADLPIKITNMVEIGTDGTNITVNKRSTDVPLPATPPLWTALAEPPGLILLILGNDLYTLLPDGTLLQYASVVQHGTGWRLVP